MTIQRQRTIFAVAAAGLALILVWVLIDEHDGGASRGDKQMKRAMATLYEHRNSLKLSDWEAGFTENIGTQWIGDLTPKQRAAAKTLMFKYEWRTENYSEGDDYTARGAP